MTTRATDLRPRSSVESQYLRCNRAFFSPILARYLNVTSCMYFRFDTFEIPHVTKNAHFDKGHGRVYSRNAHSSGGNLKGFVFSSPNILKEREFALGGMVSGFVFRHLFETGPQAIYPPFVETHFVNTKFFGIEHRMIYPKIQGGVRFCTAFNNGHMLHWTHNRGELKFCTINNTTKICIFIFTLLPGLIVRRGKWPKSHRRFWARFQASACFSSNLHGTLVF